MHAALSPRAGISIGALALHLLCFLPAQAGSPQIGQALQSDVYDVNHLSTICDRSTVAYIGSSAVDDQFVESVATWDLLHWGTCSDLEYSLPAGAYFFTESDNNHSSLRTYFMTGDECTEAPCKSGYRFTTRYRSNLSTNHDDHSIDGEIKVYVVVPNMFGASLVSGKSFSENTYTVGQEAVYAGKVEFSAESNVYGGFGEPVYSFTAYDENDNWLATSYVRETIIRNAFCAGIQDNFEDELEDRLAGNLGTSGSGLVSAFEALAEERTGSSTTSGLSEAALIETTHPAAAHALDAALRAQVALWICEEEPEIPDPGDLPTGPGTVQTL